MSRFMSLLGIQLKAAFQVSVINASIKNRDSKKIAVALAFGALMAWSLDYVLRRLPLLDGRISPQRRL